MSTDHKDMLLEDFLRLSFDEQFNYNPIWAAIVQDWKQQMREGVESDLDFPCPYCEGDDPTCPCQTSPLGGDE